MKEWKNAFTGSMVSVDTLKDQRDILIRVTLNKEVPVPQSNTAVYRFYDYMGAVTELKNKARPKPFRFSVGKFACRSFSNTASKNKTLDFVELTDTEITSVIQQMSDAYSKVLSTFQSRT